MGIHRDRAQVSFARELAWISNPEIKEFTLQIFDTFGVDYFWERAASKSEKFHPIFSMGTMGLARHSQIVAEYAHEYSRAMGSGRNSSHPQGEDIGPYHDVMVGAGLTHDLMKEGDPQRAREPVRQGRDGYSWITGCHGVDLCEAIFRDIFGRDPSKISRDKMLFMYAIAGHMGCWTKPSEYNPWNYADPEIQKVAVALHTCDYMAARKNIIDGSLVTFRECSHVKDWEAAQAKKKK